MTCSSLPSQVTKLLGRFAKVRQITCLGEAMIEVSFDDVMSRTATVGVAGDVLNTAYYLRLFADPGVEVRFSTALGNDPYSKRVLKFAEESNLLTDATVTRVDKTVGLYAISTDPSGERSFTYWREVSAARTMMDDTALVELLGRPDALFVSGITIAILPESGRKLLLDWIKIYRVDGGLVVFDPNYRPALWASPEVARSWMLEVMGECDLILPSFDDECLLWSDPTVGHTISRVITAGVPTGVVKNGGKGPVCFGFSCLAQVFEPATSVVNTTGAGDSFNGRFLAEIINASPPAVALQKAHHTAVKVISSRGAILPTSALTYSQASSDAQ